MSVLVVGCVTLEDEILDDCVFAKWLGPGGGRSSSTLDDAAWLSGILGVGTRIAELFLLRLGVFSLEGGRDVIGVSGRLGAGV